MAVLPNSVEKVIEAFSRLPGVGPKTAARMAYYYLRAPKDRSEELATALIEMKENTVNCERCYNIADSNPCSICSDPNRDSSKVCIVEEPLDVVAIESSGVFNGLYFVLGGVISPADGIGPESLRMSELRSRLKQSEALELIVATNPSLEGEATASYIVDTVNAFNNEDFTVTRLAMGLPTGADLEYADRMTLKRSLEGRTRIK